MPTVSVIIPTYNRANLLPRAINSVLNQTYQDFELIVVDDGSTDNTRDIIREFQKKDDRIKYLWKKNSDCVAVPLNLGISHSRGLYITFLGSDDECLPKWLEKQMDLFEFPEFRKPDVVSCDTLLVNQNGKKITEIAKPKTKDNDYILATSLIHNYIFGNIIVCRDIFEKVEFFDEKLKIREDFDMWIRIAKAGFHFDFVYEPLYVIHMHRDQLSSYIDAQKRISAIEYLLEKHKNLYLKYSYGYAKTLRNLGTTYILAGRMTKGRKYFIKAIRLQPTNLRHYINLILSFFGQWLFSFILKLKRRFIFSI